MDAEQQNVQLPSRSECESDVANREGCSHKRSRRENDIGKFQGSLESTGISNGNFTLKKS